MTTYIQARVPFRPNPIEGNVCLAPCGAVEGHGTDCRGLECYGSNLIHDGSCEAAGLWWRTKEEKRKPLTDNFR